ncbi:MAG: hypothetical protein NC347_03235 [Clostridium sp.]|nr:hypothetical protein [Clostridium sp.]
MKPYMQYIDDYVVFHKNRMKVFMWLAAKGLLPGNIRFILPEGAYAILGYRRISIQDLINITFDLPPDNQDYEKPCFEWDKGRREYLLDKYQLKKGKFVILGLEAVSIERIALDYWERIAKKYKDMGYQVISNLSSPEQSPVPGTIGLFLPLNEIYLLAEYGGYFIGLRSGLCDLLAFSGCGMTVIYPTEQDRYKYSFANMCFAKEITEILVCEVEGWLRKLVL